MKKAAGRATPRRPGHSTSSRRLVELETWRDEVHKRLEAGDKRFDSIDLQLTDMRLELQRLPVLLSTLIDDQTRAIKGHIDIKVGTIGSQQHGLASRVRNLEEIADQRDGLVPEDNQ